MTTKAAEAKAAYMRAWREKNRDHVRKYAAEWRKNNPDKVAKHMETYWEKQADKATDRLAKSIAEEQEQAPEVYAHAN